MLADRGCWLRPWGYYRFELGVTAHWWHEEIACLLDRDLISQNEIPVIEKQHRALAENCGMEFASSFENPEWVRQQGYDCGLLKRFAEEFDVDGRWHGCPRNDSVTGKPSAVKPAGTTRSGKPVKLAKFTGFPGRPPGGSGGVVIRGARFGRVG